MGTEKKPKKEVPKKTRTGTKVTGDRILELCAKMSLITERYGLTEEFNAIEGMIGLMTLSKCIAFKMGLKESDYERIIETSKPIMDSVLFQYAEKLEELGELPDRVSIKEVELVKESDGDTFPERKKTKDKVVVGPVLGFNDGFWE